MGAPPPPGMLAQLFQRIGAPGGGPPGAGPPGAGPGGPPPDLSNVQGMDSVPPGQEGAIFTRAVDALGILMRRYTMRSPKLAKELATALVHLKQAQELSASLPAEPVATPPPGMPAGGGMMGSDMGGGGMPGLGG